MKNHFHLRNPFLQLSYLRRCLFFILLFLSEEDLLEEALDYIGSHSRSNIPRELMHIFPGVFM